MHQQAKSGQPILHESWWRHQIETFSALLALCAGNSPITSEFHSQRPVTRSFDAFFDLCLNKRMSKQSWDWRFETPSRSLWRHCNKLPFFCSLFSELLLVGTQVSASSCSFPIVESGFTENNIHKLWLPTRGIPSHLCRLTKSWNLYTMRLSSII